MSANLSREEKLLVEARYRSAQHENEKAIDVYRALFTLFPDTLDYGFKLAAAQARAARRTMLWQRLSPCVSSRLRLPTIHASIWWRRMRGNR
jgi:hypothetical protein